MIFVVDAADAGRLGEAVEALAKHVLAAEGVDMAGVPVAVCLNKQDAAEAAAATGGGIVTEEAWRAELERQGVQLGEGRATATMELVTSSQVAGDARTGRGLDACLKWMYLAMRTDANAVARHQRRTAVSA